MMSNRLPLILANWKMNKNRSEIHEFLQAITGKLPLTNLLQVGVAAQSVYLEKMVDYVNHHQLPLDIFSENLFYVNQGSYTGETSPAALVDIGVKGSIIGHYERRKLFKESNGSVGLKVAASLKNGLLPLVAISEDTSTYDPTDIEMSPLTEIAISFAGIDKKWASKIVVAYEPAWAIGSDRTPTLKEIEHAAKVIRQSLTVIFGSAAANQIRIQYGGAVTPENAKAIFALPNIDGLLIGRSSLVADNFLRIIDDALAVEKE
ncbi:triose-phosphate isomerase [Fructilactobacillus myrtifloralis]|uniref:Triosephosphate isomerase n=1 Tax=Fructilactobacillus myrtifloralis TaxID=2940301 RepID=A0ABY5BNI3_9LACO|nr:triose-phosphate isomerase [Fructilactobacillus myrtifloralis]USS85039.1 triose-phosphate isomerase [Fructilactobacillus myrtifloralis]